MTVVQFDAGSCDRVRRYMDSYISGELLVETNQEVLRHMESCPACAREMDARVRVKNLVHEAVRRQDVPGDLEARIRQRLESASAKPSPSPWGRWMLVAATVLLACVGGLVAVRQFSRPHDLRAFGQDSMIAELAARVPKILRSGLGDHLHCTVARPYPKGFVNLGASRPQNKLEPAYEGLTKVARENAPKGFDLVLAHQCRYKGRRFMHFAVRSEDALMSLIVTPREQGESFASENLLPVLQKAGLTVYDGSVKYWEIAGFETRDHLAFVVSDLGPRQHRKIAGAISVAVNDFLRKLEG